MDAFLTWKHRDSNSPAAEPDPGMPHTPLADYTILCIDIFGTYIHWSLFSKLNLFTVGQSEKTFRSNSTELYANETLIRSGYLATVPIVPHTAISLDCLQLYRTLRGRCGAVSIEAFVRVLCDWHNVRSILLYFGSASNNVLRCTSTSITARSSRRPFLSIRR